MKLQLALKAWIACASRSKKRKMKILAYKKVREFSSFCIFAINRQLYELLPAIILFKERILVYILRSIDENIGDGGDIVRTVCISSFFHTNPIFART